MVYDSARGVQINKQMVIFAAIAIPIAVVVLVFVSDGWAIVGPGEAGILVRLGAVDTENVLPEGFHWKVPMMDKIEIFDVKMRKAEAKSSASSKDLQMIRTAIVVNYKVVFESAARLRQEVGRNFEDKVIVPAIAESIKATTARFQAERLITERPQVRDQMEETLKEKLHKVLPGMILVQQFNIIDFQFSPRFNQAIEAKQAAEQEALKARNELERIKFEAMQKVERAKAEAESIRLQSTELADNPMILLLRFIEKWDGTMPQVIGTNPTVLLDLMGSMKSQSKTPRAGRQ